MTTKLSTGGFILEWSHSSGTVWNNLNKSTDHFYTLFKYYVMVFTLYIYQNQADQN